MAFSLTQSIIPMSELRADPEKVKKRLKNSPVIITNKGKPDFGVCDLETLEIASHVKDMIHLIKERFDNKMPSKDIEQVFQSLDKKYGL